MASFFWLFILGASGCLARSFDRDGGQGSETLETVTLTPDRGSVEENRPRVGVWLTHVGSQVFESKESLERALEVAHDMGINTIYPVVWNKGLTNYPSSVLEAVIGRKISPQFEGRDPLAEILEINSRRQFHLDIIPWFEYGLKVFAGMGHVSQLEEANLSPEQEFAYQAMRANWLLKDRQERVLWHDENINATFAFLNPAHPEVARFIGALVSEFVSQYDVSGYQFDDHFSIHKDFGFGPEQRMAFDQFMQEKNNNKYSFANAPNLSAEELRVQEDIFRGFRINQVENLAFAVASQVQRLKPKIARQISPAGEIGFSYRKWLQNWRGFVERGHYNEFVVQAYRDTLPEFAKLIRNSSVRVSRTKAAGSVGIFSGYKGKPRPTQLLVQQVRDTASQGMGVNFFFYDTLVLAGNQSDPNVLDHSRIQEIKSVIATSY